ncbi:hypothetical protein C7H19_17570 [Aphanothece hegewaldii CCALA 016]|uniref:Peptidase S8 n=1 Tax=Aphanothece hegewaldii CCALA 016 TaxID=2107694 RepID=A0A2T1LUH7_9CHRO|nr:S8 family serine peptidase [Aphanothece hegewaldii]PSF35190.1 hypothetical protein C7H19_17570 [Aphanothece hegewaldii CCALA 016]
MFDNALPLDINPSTLALEPQPANSLLPDSRMNSDFILNSISEQKNFETILEQFTGLSNSLAQQTQLVSNDSLIQAGKPDLVINKMTTPTSATVTSTINFNYTIKNQGTASTGWSGGYTSFYLSKNLTLDNSDIYLTDDYSDTLAAGASRSESTYFYLSSDLAIGNYYILAKADEYNYVEESNESNNIFAKAITIQELPKPDLVISDLTVPSDAVGGDYLTIDYTIANQGLGSTDWNGSNNKFYLSTDATLTNSDIYIGSDYTYSMEAGTSQNSSAYIYLDETITTGTYYLFAQADGDKYIAESNETNNLRYKTINITEAPKPDLLITKLVAPQTVTAGYSLDVTFTLRNKGDASTGWYGSDTKFYLSQDTVIDANDTYLDQVSSYYVDPDTSSTEKASIALSSKLAGGNYYLIAKADGNNDLVEKNENNNTFYTSIQVTPSLDGYSSFNGYGLVDAAEAVAKALGQNPFPSVPNLGGKNWGADLIKAPEVWAKGYTGNGIIVAVLDTGVDRNHADLSSNIWHNPGEINGNGIDDDNNGFVDDYWGWNFNGNNNNTMDGHSHGTHVSGTIAGVKNDFGVTGIAYNAKIMPVKVLSDSGSGSDRGVAKGIRYAADNGARVINMSLGGGNNNAELRAAVEYASSKGAIVVMAAGNDGDSTTMGHYPAAYATQWGIAVGAVDKRNNMADFSNRAGGTNLAYITAPGVDVYSTVPNNKYDTYSGTSMATPHMAGVIALMLSAKGTLTDAQVRSILISTSENSPTASQTNSLSAFLSPVDMELTQSQFTGAATNTQPTWTRNDSEKSIFITGETVHISSQYEYEQASLTSFDQLTGLVFQSQLTNKEII